MKLCYTLFVLSVLSIDPSAPVQHVHGWTSEQVPNHHHHLHHNKKKLVRVPHVVVADNNKDSSSPTALHYANHEPSSYVTATPPKPAGSRVGEVVWNGPHSYVLTGHIPVASPKCEIYKAYKLSSTTGSIGQVERSTPLIVKFSHHGVDHEYWNYQRLFAKLQPHQQDLFVTVYDKIPAGTTSSSSSSTASSTSNTFAPWPTSPAGLVPPSSKDPAGIVMERGKDNLRMYIRNHGPYRGDALRQAMHSVIRSVHALHSNDMVWTELKPENFVVTSTGIKGIDLESLIPTRDLLQVYTAEACPPEFPIEDMYQTLPVLNVQESFDIWGLGLVLFEIATGKPFYYKGMTDLSYIQDCLRNIQTTLDDAESKLVGVVDPQAASIIRACLQPNPRYRPSCQELLQHSYFFASRSTGGNSSNNSRSGGMPSFYETHPSASANFGTPTTTTNTNTNAFATTADKEPLTMILPLPHRRRPVTMPQEREQKLQQQQQQQQYGGRGQRPRSMTRLPDQQQYTTMARSVSEPSSSSSSSRRRQVGVVPPSQEQPNEDESSSSSTPTTTTTPLCWKSQLGQVLETLQQYAQEDPAMATDLKSILDHAKDQLVRGSACGAAVAFYGAAAGAGGGGAGAGGVTE